MGWHLADIKKILSRLHCLKEEGERENKRQVLLTSSFFAICHKGRVALCAEPTCCVASLKQICIWLVLA